MPSGESFEERAKHKKQALFQQMLVITGIFAFYCIASFISLLLLNPYVDEMAKEESQFHKKANSTTMITW